MRYDAIPVAARQPVEIAPSHTFPGAEVDSRIGLWSDRHFWPIRDEVTTQKRSRAWLRALEMGSGGSQYSRRQ